MVKSSSDYKIRYKGKLNKWVSGKDLILYTIGKMELTELCIKTMEFTGEVINKLPMHERFTMANMAIEAAENQEYFMSIKRLLTMFQKEL
jgi:3-isopropylmalate/(R)-2-methylmalate dehydratase large subunit